MVIKYQVDKSKYILSMINDNGRCTPPIKRLERFVNIALSLRFKCFSPVCTGAGLGAKQGRTQVLYQGQIKNILGKDE